MFLFSHLQFCQNIVRPIHSCSMAVTSSDSNNDYIENRTIHGTLELCRLGIHFAIFDCGRRASHLDSKSPSKCAKVYLDALRSFDIDSTCFQGLSIACSIAFVISKPNLLLMSTYVSRRGFEKRDFLNI